MALSSRWSAATELYLRDQVTASPTGLSVADLLEPGGPSTASRDALRQALLLGVGSRPALVTVSELRTEVHRALGSSYVLVGNAVAVVPGDVSDPGRRAFIEALLATARGFIAPSTRRLELELIDDRAADTIDPARPVTIRIVAAERRGNLVNGIARVAFRQTTTKGAVRSGECIVNVHHAVAVPVAAQALRPGDALHDGAVRGESKWLSELSTVPPAEAGSLAGLTVSRHVRPGTILADRLLTKHVLVRAGSMVNARFRRGAVSVRLPARAQESGSLDEVIRIRMPGTGRRFHAEVIGAAEVRVDDP
jgi:flagella basal body P-ring formation protein FlgA